MAADDLDLSEFEEFSSTAKERARRTSSEPTRRGGNDGSTAGGRRWPWFLMGLVLGIVVTVFGPDLAEPHIPQVLQRGGEEVRGPVVAKQVENDRVLLTVNTERGALLATFRQRVPEIDLLVEEGDTVTLGIPAYAPLVEDPTLSAVRKDAGGAPEPLSPLDEGGAGLDEPPADEEAESGGEDPDSVTGSPTGA